MNKFFKQKRGMAFYPVVIITLLLVILIVYLSFVRKTIDIVASADPDCKASVLAHVRFGSEINCPVEFVSLRNTNEEKTKEQLANLMVRCFDNYGSGRVDLFSAESSKFCAVCSVVSYQNQNNNIVGLTEYLTSNNFFRAGERYNYYSYLSGEPISQEFLLNIASKEFRELDTLLAKNNSIILFHHHKTLSDDKSSIITKAVLAAGAVGAVAFLVVTAPVSLPVSVIVIGTGVAGLGAGVSAAVITSQVVDSPMGVMILNSLNEDSSSGVSITNLNTEMLKSLGCEKLPVALVDSGYGE